jgi:hypothetical protein
MYKLKKSKNNLIISRKCIGSAFLLYDLNI